MRIDWPQNDYSRVPYSVYHDPDLYQLEMERVFRGRCWSYLAFEAEVPKPGDFRTTWVGDTWRPPNPMRVTGRWPNSNGPGSSPG